MFQFVEKRREMKADGRTDKELEESYCFLMTNSVKVGQLSSDVFIIKKTNSAFSIVYLILSLFFFLLLQLPVLCEKGLTVGRSKNTVLGNPSKGRRH